MDLEVDESDEVYYGDQNLVRQSPMTRIHSNRLALSRKPRQTSPVPVSTFLQSLSSCNSRRGSLMPLDSPQLTAKEFLNHENDCENEEPPSDDSDHHVVIDDDIGGGDQCTELEQKKRRRSWETLKEKTNQDKIVRRERKRSAKGHECTKCFHFRLQKYFKDSSSMICISCLDICYTCSLVISPPPSKKSRHPKCTTCNETINKRKKTYQRSSMHELSLLKKGL